MKKENQRFYPKLDTQTAKSFMTPLLSCSSKDEVSLIKKEISETFGRPGLAKITTMLSEEQIKRLSGLPQSISHTVEPINTEHPTDEDLLAYIAEPLDVDGVRKRKQEVIEKWGQDALVRISKIPIKSTLYGRISPFPYFSPRQKQEPEVESSGHWRSLKTGELRVGLQLKVDRVRSGHHGKIGEYYGGRDDMYDRGRKQNVERYGVIIAGREWFFEKKSLLVYDPNPQPVELEAIREPDLGAESGEATYEWTFDPDAEADDHDDVSDWRSPAIQSSPKPEIQSEPIPEGWKSPKPEEIRVGMEVRVHAPGSDDHRQVGHIERIGDDGVFIWIDSQVNPKLAIKQLLIQVEDSRLKSEIRFFPQLKGLRFVESGEPGKWVTTGLAVPPSKSALSQLEKRLGVGIDYRQACTIKVKPPALLTTTGGGLNHAGGPINEF